MIQLQAMTDRDFAWLLGAVSAPADAPRVCAGGVAPTEVTALIRGVSADIAQAVAGDVAWLVIADGEAVGMISFTKADDRDRPTIGYGIATAREGRGHATAALAALIPIARAAGHAGLTAETATDNRASQLVLERNGFVRTGERTDPEDGALYLWALDWTQDKA